MSTAGASVWWRSFAPSPLSVGTVCALVLAGAAAGLLLGGVVGDRSSPAVRSASEPQTMGRGGLRVEVAKGWTRGGAATLPGFVRPLGLSNPDRSLGFTAERLPVTSATLVPDALAKEVATAPRRPADFRLRSGRPAWRYRLQRRDGSLIVLYAAPVVGGVVTMACASPAVATIPPGCDAVARAVTIAPGWHALAPGRAAGFFSRLPAVRARLQTARAAGGRQLGAATLATAQAAAAERLARAHRAAGAALSPLAGEPAQRTTVRALSATANAYTELAGAARARVSRRYATARRTVIAADARLRRSMARVAAAASAAGRIAVSPARAPAASPSSRADGSFALLALLGACAMFLAARDVLRELNQ
jgi:hypothetical protein